MRFDQKWNHLAAFLCVPPRSVMILGSVKCNLSYDTGVAAFQASVFNFPRIPRRTHEAPRPRCHRRAPLMRPWMSTIGDGEIESDAESKEPQDDERYFDLKDLLDDTSTVDNILAKMAAKAPPIPVLEDTVFRRALGHHCAIRTANISRAMKFYSLLGLNEAVRFTAGNARCALLEGAGIRLELIEVPPSMRPPDKAPDLAADMRSTGLNHIAFDVGPAIEAEGLRDMKAFLVALNRQSEEIFGMSVRLVVSPFEQRIGQDVYDLAFIVDADGVLLELLHQKLNIDTEMPQAW